jgi:hypothetical protein
VVGGGEEGNTDSMHANNYTNPPKLRGKVGVVFLNGCGLSVFHSNSETGGALASPPPPLHPVEGVKGYSLSDSSYSGADPGG